MYSESQNVGTLDLGWLVPGCLILYLEGMRIMLFHGFGCFAIVYYGFQGVLGAT